MLDVDVNGKQYALVEGGSGAKVTTRPVQQFTQSFRTTGRTRPEDIAPYESFIVPNLAYGFGRYRINSDVAFDPKEYRRFWNSTCETRWMDAVYLPILPEDASQTESGKEIDVARASASFKGELNLLGEDLVSTGVNHAVNRQFSGGTDKWENGGYVTANLQGTGTLMATNTTSAVTSAFTVPTGLNRCIIAVLVGIGSDSASISDPSAITYDGDAMTKLTSDAGTKYEGIYYLANPSTGSNTFSITWSLAGASRDGFITLLAFHDVDQGTPMSSGAVASGTATSASTDVTTVAGDYVISAVNILTADSGTQITTGALQTSLNTGSGLDDDDSTKSGEFAVSYEIAATTTTTLSYAFDGSEAFEHITAIVNPALIATASDIIAHKTNLVALVCCEDDHRIYTSTDGVTWSIATTPITAGLLADSVTANEQIDAGLLTTIGGEIVAAVWDEDSGTITFFSSTNAGVVWADESVDIASINGPQGIAIYPDIDGENKIYLATSEGIYVIDTAPSTWTYELLLPMTNSIHNGRRMTVHQGSLWFAQGVGNDSPAPIYKLTVQGNSRTIDAGYGLSYGDGVPVDLHGQVNYMRSSGDFLFASVGGGAASRNGRVICFNDRGWHSMVKHGTADRDMEWIDVGSGDDGVPRLHYATRTNSTTSDLQFLEQPLVNPRSGITIKRKDLDGTNAGHIELPYYDFGLPQESKSILAVHVVAEDLTDTSNEFIEVEYGINGAVTTTDLANFTSSTVKATFASDAGLSAKNIGFRLKFNRADGTNTNTPKLRDFVVEGYVSPGIAYEHQMTIDIKETADLTGLSVETVISNLETIVSSVTQVVLKFGSVSKYVAVDRERSAFSFALDAWENAGPTSLADRTGVFNLVLIEKVAS